MQTLRVVGVWLCLALGMSVGAHAQTAGKVEFARGVGFAQSTGQVPRTLGQGLVLNEGDKLSTAEGAFAIVKMNDGTQMTIRPNSQLMIQQYQFKESDASNSMVLRLLQGGFRAVTGLINKNLPGAARVVTSTATIGIRGTDFDARICAEDCKRESSKVPEKARANAVLASAKLVTLQGDVNVVDTAGATRRVVEGASVYPGEQVYTGANASAVFAFRDESRVTVGASTNFRVDSFIFDPQNPSEGRFLVSLLRGSMRALTGLIGKVNNRNVSFSTATATVGIRGTGLDLDCSAEASCSFYTWLGSIEVMQLGQTNVQVLQVGEGLQVTPLAVLPISSPTLDGLTRPDEVKVDTPALFSTANVDEGKEGLYVFVRDGHVEVTTDKETLQLGKGETGFADVAGQTIRPTLTPLFLDFDTTPRPNSKNPALRGVLSDAGVRSINQCR